MDEEKLKCFKVSSNGSSCVYSSYADVLVEITGLLEDGTEVKITPVEMTESELDKLPEFTGW